MKINLNQMVKVKLTAEGIQALRFNHIAMYKRIYNVIDIPSFTPPEVDAEGYSTFQLWWLMNQFGPHISLGKGNVFDEFSIELVK